MAERTRVDDITKLAVGQVILVNGIYDHTSTRMTVKAPYGAHEGRWAVVGQGVLCTALTRRTRKPYELLLTEAMAEGSEIFLWEEPPTGETEERNRLWYH